MKEWTHKDIEGELEHITIREKYRDGMFVRRELIAHEGHSIYSTLEVYDDYHPDHTKYVLLPIDYDYTLFKAIKLKLEEATETDYINALKRLGVYDD